jgi:hypothetical protein
MTAENYLPSLELEREALVRRVPCPVCGCAPGEKCHYGRRVSHNIQCISHTGRYNAAADMELVPTLTRQTRCKDGWCECYV